MNTIHKITVSYDEQEDRLHFACEEAAGKVQGLWLTQRLANRLVMALFSQLDGAVAYLPDVCARETVQAWEQSAARVQLTLNPSTPVPGSTVKTNGLVTSIDISQTDGNFKLVFRWPENHAAVLTLNSIVLRQWLAIVHDTYAKAEWLCAGVWPSWFETANQTNMVNPDGVSLH